MITVYDVSDASSSNGDVFTVNDTLPAANEHGRPADFTKVPSNTTFYARLVNVISDHMPISTQGSDVELTTLKQTPYDSSDATKKVSMMKPSLLADDKTH